MTRRRQRNSGSGKKTRSVRGGELNSDLKKTANNDIETLLGQYFRGEEDLDSTLLAKYSTIKLDEFTPIYQNYSKISRTSDYLNAFAKYGGIRSDELDVISFSSTLNAVTTALGVASMSLIVSMQAAAFAGNAGVVATIGTATAGTISSATTSVITAIGGATALGLTATGLGLIVLFGLVSTMVYVSNLYLKEKELQELSRLIVGVCEYIKNDAHIIHMFYKDTGTKLKPGAKLASLLKQLYNLMFKTLSYFPEKYFYDAYKNYLNTENVAVRMVELNQVYNVYNTENNYLNCNEQNIDILLQTGNFLMYRYIFVRLCIIDKQRYLIDSNQPSQIQSGGDDLLGTKNFATSLLGKGLSSVSDTVSKFGSNAATGITSLGSKINKIGTAVKDSTSKAIDKIDIISPIYQRYRKYFRPIAEVEKEYNASITNVIPSKAFVEQTVSATANSSFLYSGEQFRQLLGDYAIMDTTYTMSVTKYVFDFNTYLITNMGNSDELKKAVPSSVTDTNQILAALVGTKDSEGKITETPETNSLKEKIAVMLYPLLAEKVYKDIFVVFNQKIRPQITDTAVNTALLITNSALFSKLNNPDAKDVAIPIMKPISKNDINVSIAQSDTQPNTPPNSQPNTP